MTKEELLSFIDYENEQEKNDADFYISAKGIELHRRIISFLGFDFSENKKIRWRKISEVLKRDKRLRDIIYIYLATLEEYIRAFISNKYHDNASKNFWVTDTKKRNNIKNNIELGQDLFLILENTEFGCLIKQVNQLPSEDKQQLFGNAYCEKNLCAVKELRNAVSHHKFLSNYKFKSCIINGIEGDSLIDNIKNLRQLLPERYRYGKNGKGGITAEVKKCGINLY